MFIEYLEKLRSEGRRTFTFDMAIKDLKATVDSVKSGIRRLKKSGKLISPAKGFYVIIPPEHQKLGSLPPEELVPLLMGHLGANYYVALLSAAMYHGASHQKPARFQVFVDKKIKREVHYGRVHIEYIYKKTIKTIPIQEVVVKTGYLRVATPELTAMDLLLHTRRSGGINHVATVFAELVASLDPAKLLILAKKVRNHLWLQRLGYILDHIEPLDELANKRIIQVLKDYLATEDLSRVPLVPDVPMTGYPHSNVWNIVENITIEEDA